MMNEQQKARIVEPLRLVVECVDQERGSYALKVAGMPRGDHVGVSRRPKMVGIFHQIATAVLRAESIGADLSGAVATNSANSRELVNAIRQRDALVSKLREIAALKDNPFDFGARAVQIAAAAIHAFEHPGAEAFRIAQENKS